MVSLGKGTCFDLNHERDKPRGSRASGFFFGECCGLVCSLKKRCNARQIVNVLVLRRILFEDLK